MKIFGFMLDPDNKFGRITGAILRIVLCNLLFLLYSIPVITMGASYTALCSVMIRTFRSPQDVSVIADFRKAFRTNLKQATVCWVLAILILILGIVDLSICQSMGTVGMYLQFAVAAFLLFGVIYLLFLFPAIAAFDNTIGKLMQHAFYFFMKNPLAALAMAGCQIVPVTLMFLDQVNQPTYVFCFFFFGFALCTKGSMWILTKVFEHYLPSKSYS